MRKDTEDILKSKLNFPVQTLMELSCDAVHGTYMTDSNITAVDFDELKKVYCTAKGIEKHLSSNDALYISEEQWYFIEFKNGQITEHGDGHTTIGSLESKITHSMLILFSPDYTGLKLHFPMFVNDISFSLKYMSYILVYNDIKNRKPTNADKESWKKQIKRGEFEKELKFLELNYKKILLTKEAKKFENMKLEKFIGDSIQKERFMSLIRDIRHEISHENESACDDILDNLSQEAHLPLMRFGLEEYEGKLFHKVYTYTGDTFDDMGEVQDRGQFHRYFIEKIKTEEL